MDSCDSCFGARTTKKSQEVSLVWETGKNVGEFHVLSALHSEARFLELREVNVLKHTNLADRATQNTKL